MKSFRIQAFAKFFLAAVRTSSCLFNPPRIIHATLDENSSNDIEYLTASRGGRDESTARLRMLGKKKSTEPSSDDTNRLAVSTTKVKA